MSGRKPRALAWGGPEGCGFGPVTPIDPDCWLETKAPIRAPSTPFQHIAVLKGKMDPAGDLAGNAILPVPGNMSITMGAVPNSIVGGRGKYRRDSDVWPVPLVFSLAS